MREINFVSHNLEVKLYVWEKENLNSDSKPELFYGVDVYGDIGETELDFLICGTIPERDIAPSDWSIEEVFKASRVQDDFCFDWGQVEIMILNRGKREVHLVIFTDEYKVCRDNYFSIKIPDEEIDNVTNFLEELYKGSNLRKTES